MPTRSTMTPSATRPASRAGSRPRTAGIALAAWALLLGVVTGLGWLITHPLRTAVDPWDNDLSRWFAGERTPALSTAADVGTLLGETVVGLGVALLAGIAFSLWQRSWSPVVFVALAEAGIGALYAVVTHVDPRRRPPVDILDRGLVPDHSFPSGHVATAVVAYGGLFLLTVAYVAAARRLALPLLLLPVVVLLSRLYQGAHHLTDVLTSVGYASVWLLVLARLLLPRLSSGR
jgi:undecaprenyl-diphosphatase